MKTFPDNINEKIKLAATVGLSYYPQPSIQVGNDNQFLKNWLASPTERKEILSSHLHSVMGFDEVIASIIMLAPH